MPIYFVLTCPSLLLSFLWPCLPTDSFLSLNIPSCFQPHRFLCSLSMIFPHNPQVPPFFCFMAYKPAFACIHNIKPTLYMWKNTWSLSESAHFAWHNNIQFNVFPCRCYDFIFLYSQIGLHCSMCFVICLLMDMQAASSWLLWGEQQCVQMCKSCLGVLTSESFGRTQVAHWVACYSSSCRSLRTLHTDFPQWLYHFTYLPAVSKASFPHILPRVTWALRVVLIYISLMAKCIERLFSRVYCPLYLFFWELYLQHISLLINYMINCSILAVLYIF